MEPWGQEGPAEQAERGENAGRRDEERTGPLLQGKDRKEREIVVPIMGDAEEAALVGLIRPLQTY